MNDLTHVYKKILLEFYNTNGYIKITEELGHWDLKESFMPTILMSADFVTVFQDEEGNQGSDELSLSRQLFANNYAIWDSIFRDAMATDKMEITYE